ncbi:radical SAM protein, partial [Candidatus Omnitrophota bacterium]
MKKIIAILIIILFIPSHGLCLRPQSASMPGGGPATILSLRNAGSATIAFRLMNSILPSEDSLNEAFKLMIAFRCNFNCDHCSAKGSHQYGVAKYGSDAFMPKAELCKTLDQFRGFRRLHVVGAGETTLYGRVFDDFIDVISYAADAVDEIRVGTNGFRIPEDVIQAEKFFRQFPEAVLKKVVWYISVDRYHEGEMKRVTGKSLRKIVATLEELEARGIIRTGYNVGLVSPTNKVDSAKYSTSVAVLAYFGLAEKYELDKEHFRIFRFIKLGNAAKNEIGARQVKPEYIDQVNRHPSAATLFIDP